MRTYEILYRAADHIDSRGWWQDLPSCTSVGTCAANAIRWAAGADTQAVFAARFVLAKYLGLDNATMLRTLDAVIAWNDTPGRTRAEVVAALRAAAVQSEADAIIAGANSQPVAVFVR